AFFQFRLLEGRAGQSAREAGERYRNRVRLVLIVDRSQGQLAALLERIDEIVGQRSFGDAAIREADAVFELDWLVVVDLKADTGRNQTADRNGHLKDLAVDLALDLDEVDGGQELAGIRGDDVLRVADVIVFLLRADLEPAL